MSSSYDFVTRWSVQASREAVWKEISEADRWPSWWPGVVAVQLLEPGDADGVGAYRRFTWRSRLPYTLRFNMRTTRVETLHVIEGVADGELSGFGRWQLSDAGPRVDVRYDWRVDANKAWMRMLAPVARPIFAWNHDVVMRWGQEALSLALE